MLGSHFACNDVDQHRRSSVEKLSDAEVKKSQYKVFAQTAKKFLRFELFSMEKMYLVWVALSSLIFQT